MPQQYQRPGVVHRLGVGLRIQALRDLRLCHLPGTAWQVALQLAVQLLNKKVLFNPYLTVCQILLS